MSSRGCNRDVGLVGLPMTDEVGTGREGQRGAAGTRRPASSITAVGKVAQRPRSAASGSVNCGWTTAGAPPSGALGRRG